MQVYCTQSLISIVQRVYGVASIDQPRSDISTTDAQELRMPVSGPSVWPGLECWILHRAIATSYNGLAEGSSLLIALTHGSSKQFGWGAGVADEARVTHVVRAPTSRSLRVSSRAKDTHYILH